MKVARVKVAEELYKQYQQQGQNLPIYYPISVDLVFYVLRHHEPDLDNLPAFIMDAMQGISVKGCRALKVSAILTDDKLVREEHSKKIVEGDVDYDGEPRTEIAIKRYHAAVGAEWKRRK
jgi:Holliday junction resolvase RusA-like endonuclease